MPFKRGTLPFMLKSPVRVWAVSHRCCYGRSLIGGRYDRFARPSPGPPPGVFYVPLHVLAAERALHSGVSLSVVQPRYIFILSGDDSYQGTASGRCAHITEKVGFAHRYVRRGSPVGFYHILTVVAGMTTGPPSDQGAHVWLLALTKRTGRDDT
eukprot:2219452-Pyramimonas_sp.AAC.2